MPGLSPKLPLSIDEIDGLATTKDFREVAQQNLKTIVLTSPGERIMIPNFGVGIRNFLFENATESTFSTIRQRIIDQTKVYAPYINIRNISFSGQGTNVALSDIDPSISSNYVNINISYTIPTIFISDTLTLQI